MIDSVLLIRPFGVGKKEFPVGILYIGTSLKKSGYDVQIIDLMDTPGKEEEVISTLNSNPNMMLAISALAPHYRWVKQFSKQVKKEIPACHIVVGGHVSVLYEFLLRKTGVDYVCRGKGEFFLPELIDKINNNKPLRSISGLAFIKDNELVNTGRKTAEPGSQLPNYKLIDLDRYLIHPTEDSFFRRSKEYLDRASEEDKLAVIMFSRGCIAGCTFCYRHIPGFQQTPVEDCIEHIRLLYNNYGVRYLRIDDELFTNDTEWFDSFCESIKMSEMDILFRITGLRPGAITPEQLQKLKEIGCIAINYGIESGSQKILEIMNKGTSVDDNLSSIRETLGAGMQTMGYFIFGFQGEDDNTLKETISLVLDSGLSRQYVSVFYAVALPGTKLYRDCIKNGKIKNEEKFLEDLSSYIEEDKSPYEHYTLNFSEINISNIRKWEKTLFILISLNELINITPLLRNIVFKSVSLLPANRASLFMLDKCYYMILISLKVRDLIWRK